MFGPLPRVRHFACLISFNQWSWINRGGVSEVPMDNRQCWLKKKTPPYSRIVRPVLPNTYFTEKKY